ncbi:acyltransferase [Aureimonas sp. ME7]|uniref:acyltransferase family protein n=1 Tax=Aureimonas sp. ME7 TaxID=2744252 RepID=UPI0015F71B1B|nr:acyltransferase [Aureimonas sp. ME7]
MSAAGTRMARERAPLLMPGRSLASIQTLRFVAALVVVVYHGGIAGRHHGFLGPAYDRLLALSVAGEAGVHVFFVISGFIMVYATAGRSQAGGGALAFLRHRFERIYPVYWLYASLYLLFHVLVFRTVGLEWRSVLPALALWPGSSAAIIGPGWTLSYEVYFYLVFGLCIALPVVLSLPALTLALLAMIASGIAFDLSGSFWQVVTNPLLLEFLAGVWVAKALMTWRIPAWVGDLVLLLGVVGFAAGIAAGLPDIPTVILWGIPSTCLVFGLVRREIGRGLPRLFARLSPLGDGSYSVYLLHNLLLDIALLGLVFVAGMPHGGGLAVAFAILLSWVAGQLAFERIEKPLFQALRRRRKAPTPAVRLALREEGARS